MTSNLSAIIQLIYLPSLRELSYLSMKHVGRNAPNRFSISSQDHGLPVLSTI